MYYLCTRNRKDVLITCSGKTDVATLGSDLEGIAGAKTHTASVRRIAGGLADFGLSAIRFFYSTMKPTYIILWEIVFDTLRHLWRVFTVKNKF